MTIYIYYIVQPPNPHSLKGPAMGTHPAAAQLQAANPQNPITRHFPLVEDRYAIKGVMTWGGLSTLFLAKDIRTDSDVVIKTVGKDFRKDPMYADSMRKTLSIEAKALARISSPRVVSLVSASEEYLAMEYVQGKTLQEIPFIQPNDVLALGLEMCEGLSASHAVGVIHRDLKPANFIVSESGRMILIDFGSSKLDTRGFDDPYGDSPVGTADYMAPEATENGSWADERTDTFSLAAVLYYKLAFTGPFDLDQNLDYVRAVEIRKNRYPIPLIDAAPWLPEQVCETIDRGLSEYPENRYQTAEEFRQALRACLASA